jgi:hypothetical protein
MLACWLIGCTATGPGTETPSGVVTVTWTEGTSARARIGLRRRARTRAHGVLARTGREPASWSLEKQRRDSPFRYRLFPLRQGVKGVRGKRT